MLRSLRLSMWFVGRKASSEYLLRTMCFEMLAYLLFCLQDFKVFQMSKNITECKIQSFHCVAQALQGCGILFLLIQKILAVHSSHPYCLLSVSVDLPVVDMKWKWSHKSHIPLSLSSLSLTVSKAWPCCVAHISVSSLFNSSIAFRHAFIHS